jgi:hypothetical protein
MQWIPQIFITMSSTYMARNITSTILGAQARYGRAIPTPISLDPGVHSRMLPAVSQGMAGYRLAGVIWVYMLIFATLAGHLPVKDSTAGRGGFQAARRERDKSNMLDASLGRH